MCALVLGAVIAAEDMTDSHRPAKRQRILFDAGYAVTKPASRPQGPPQETSQRALPDISGLSYMKKFVSVQEEVLILRELDSRPWRSDVQRRTQHYGGYYVYKHKAPETQRRLQQQGRSQAAAQQSEESNGVKAPEIPSGLWFISDRLIQQGIYSPDDPPTVLVVNEYVGKE